MKNSIIFFICSLNRHQQCGNDHLHKSRKFTAITVKEGKVMLEIFFIFKALFFLNLSLKDALLTRNSTLTLCNSHVRRSIKNNLNYELLYYGCYYMATYWHTSNILLACLQPRLQLLSFHTHFIYLTGPWDFHLFPELSHWHQGCCFLNKVQIASLRVLKTLQSKAFRSTMK